VDLEAAARHNICRYEHPVFGLFSLSTRWRDVGRRAAIPQQMRRHAREAWPRGKESNCVAKTLGVSDSADCGDSRD